jgi:hypothetical protein
VVLVAALAGLIWRLPETGHLDPQRAVYWGDPRVAFDPEPDTGPVLVAVHFTVAAERQADFLIAMDQLRLSRLRTGATRWELYRDANIRIASSRIFRVSSWEEHLRQHEGADAQLIKWSRRRRWLSPIPRWSPSTCYLRSSASLYALNPSR